MYKKNVSKRMIIVLSMLNVSYHTILNSKPFLDRDEKAMDIDTRLEDTVSSFPQDYPLDLSIKNKSLNFEKSSPDQSSTNNTIHKLPLVSVKSPLFINPQDILLSDSLISANVFEMNEKINFGAPLTITFRHLQFFFTKKNIYDLLFINSNNNSYQGSIMPPNQSLLTTKHLLLNIKNDIIELIAVLFSHVQIGTFNLSCLKCFNDIENFLTYTTNQLKISPAYIKADPSINYILENFIRNFYGKCNRYILCLSTNKLTKYININFPLFSLRGLLDTLIVMSFKSSLMKNDLKSIIVSILFFYIHGEGKQICTMEFILKDIMIRIISYINLYNLIKADITKTNHRKQLLYDKIENEIKKSFVMAFYSRDLTLVMSNLEFMRLEIFTSKIEVKFDFSFVVILSKVFESMHLLKSILHDIEYDQSILLKEELRALCKNLFEFKEIIFDLIKTDSLI